MDASSTCSHASARNNYSFSYIVGIRIMHDALMEHWNTRDTCPNCGEILEGDGYSNGDPVRCPNALEEDWWYSEPDSGPWYCHYDPDE